MSNSTTLERQAALRMLESEPASIREALERKVADEIERVVLAVQLGKMSSYAYHQAFQGLRGGVAGLVNRESMELITAAHKEYRGGLTDTKRSVTIIGDVVAVVLWQVGTDKMDVVLKKPGMAGASSLGRLGRVPVSPGLKFSVSGSVELPLETWLLLSCHHPVPLTPLARSHRRRLADRSPYLSPEFSLIDSIPTANRP